MKSPILDLKQLKDGRCFKNKSIILSIYNFSTQQSESKYMLLENSLHLIFNNFIWM